jgi:sulfoxide reductase heme-binding subunit YedZ
VITWIVVRAAGVAAYLMLFASVSWGLIGTTSAFGRRVAKATAVAVHQFLSTVALVFLAVHLGGLLLDRFVPFHPLDVLVPLRASYRPVAVAFGIVAMYAMLVVLVSSWLRKSVGTTWWRRLHLLAAPAFILSMVHGIFAGTDSARPWMWWVYVTTGAAAMFLVVLRGLTAGLRPARAERPAGAGRPAQPRLRIAGVGAAVETEGVRLPPSLASAKVPARSGRPAR